MFGRTGSIQLARVLGIRIGASPSWFLVLFLMIWLLSGYFGDVLDTSDGEAYAVAVAGAFLFFVSLAIHELGHAIAARRQGMEVTGIELWMLGGVTKFTRETRSPAEELKVSAAGPAATLGVVVACGVVGLIVGKFTGVFDSARLDSRSTTPAVALLGWVAGVNAVLFVFNLLPAFPLDGGRIARALAWRATGDRNRATRLAARIGQGFAWLLIGGGIVMAASWDTFQGIWTMIVGWFILQGARGAILASEFSDRLEGVTAADLMDAEPVAVPGDAPADRAHDEFFLRYGWPWFPVVDAAGRYLGVLRAERVDGAVGGGGSSATAGDLLDGETGDDFRVRSDVPLEELLGSEPLRRLGALIVVDADERLCGVLTVDRVRRAIAATAMGRS
jgi:Zn-dependent protease